MIIRFTRDRTRGNLKLQEVDLSNRDSSQLSTKTDNRCTQGQQVSALVRLGVQMDKNQSIRRSFQKLIRSKAVTTAQEIRFQISPES